MNRGSDKLGIDKCSGSNRAAGRMALTVIFGWALSLTAFAAPPQKAAEADPVRQGLGNLLQRLFTPTPPAPKPKPPTTFVPDQALLRRLVQARQLVEDKQVAAAVAVAQRILDEPEESFTREENGRWISAREEAERLIAGLGPEGIAEYRRQFGDEAAYRLRQALDDHDLLAVGSVARRYFLTPSGLQAVNLLATWHLDAGRPGMALTYLDRLADSPVYAAQLTDAQRAKRSLARRLSAKPLVPTDAAPPATIILGGERWPWDRLLDAVAVPSRPGRQPQADWPLFQANPARCALAAGGLPLLAPEWFQPSTEQATVRGLLDIAAKNNKSRQRPAVCELAPIAADGVVYVRNFTGVRATELNTGRTLWSYTAGGAVDADVLTPAYEVVLRTSTSASLEFTYVANGVHGHLAADHRRIYVIDQLRLNPSLQPQQFFSPTDPADQERRKRNRLTALDRRTGGVLWHFGATGANLAAGVFLFGPPLPVEDRLYLIGENRSELRLYCLHPDDGAVLWSQPLAMSERRIDADPFRASQACALAYSGGVLVCPTNLLRVFGVDPVTQRLLWNYSYADESPTIQRRYDPVQTIPPPANPFATDPPTIVGDRVIIASALSPYLHCVDSYTGQRLWRIDRRAEHYVGGVSDERIVLVGPSQVRGVALRDGRTLWQQQIAPPAGRGVCLGPTYLLPTADGRVIALAMADGAITRTIRSRGQLSLGNLLLHRDRLLSSGPQGLWAFPLVANVYREIDERLARQQDDPRGRYLRGQLAVSEGRPADAVADLCAALAGGRDFREKASAVALLFDIARREALADPAAAGPLLEQLKAHSDTPPRKGIYYRLLAEHHLGAGRLDAALAAVEQHANLGLTGDVAPPETAELLAPRGWTRRVAHRLLSASAPSSPSEQAPPSAGAALRRQLDARLESARRDRDSQTLAALARDWDGTPIGDRAALAWADRLMDTGQLAEAEAVLLRLPSSPDRAVAARALDALASVSEKAGTHADALFFLELLAERFADESLADGVTGRQRLQAFLQDPVHREAARPADPLANVKAVRVASVPKPQPPVRQFHMAPAPRALPFFEDWLVGFEYRAWKLLFVDRLASRAGWEVQLPTPRSYSFNFARGLGFAHAGHLLLFPLGDTVVAVSGLDRKLHWVRPARFGAAGTTVPEPAALVSGSATSPTVQLGPTGPGFVCIRTDAELFVVDPWTGEDLWGVRAPSPGLVVTADERHLYLTDSDGRYWVRRGCDGQIVFQTQLPAEIVRNRRRFVEGREFLVESTSTEKRFRLYDPVTKATLWQRAAATTAREFWGQSGELAILDEFGELVVLDPKTGATLVEDDLDPLLGTGHVTLHLFSDRARLLVSIEQRTATTGIWYVPSSPNLVTQPVNGGLFCYDRHTGRRLWRRPLEGRSIAVHPGGELPVLIVFGTRLVEQNGAKNQRVTAVEVLDKSTGKTMGEMVCSSYMAFTELATDPKERWTELRSWTMKVRIAYELDTPGK